LDHPNEEITFDVRAPIQGCDDGAYFEIQDVALVIRGRSNLLIVARALKARLATLEAIKHRCMPNYWLVKNLYSHQPKQKRMLAFRPTSLSYEFMA
jgi:hypothetical protein